MKRADHFARAIARAALGFVLAVLAGVATAHPHVRFAYVVAPVVDGDHVTGLRFDWIMDPITSWFVLRGLDKNANGVFEPDELAAFARGNQPLLAANRYFLTLTRGDAPLDFDVPTSLEARFADQRVVLSFAVRLREAPRADSPVPLGVRFFDRTWYVALDAHDPVLGETSACASQQHTATLATDGYGEQPVQETRITCAAKGLAAAR